MDFRISKLSKFISQRAWSALSRVGKFDLLVRFGLLPMLADLETLVDFTNLVDKRVEEINRLMTRGLRRTVHLWGDSSTVTGSPTGTSFNSGFGAGVSGSFVHTTCRTIRGHIRWFPSYSYQLTDAEKRAKAKQAIGGFIIDFTTLYEAMPWSWLIDYFSNLGDFVKAGRNVIPCTHDLPKMIVHTTSEWRSWNHQILTPTLKMSTIVRNYDKKERFPVTASLSAHMDFLTEDQTSILGSLAISKWR